MLIDNKKNAVYCKHRDGALKMIQKLSVARGKLHTLNDRHLCYV